MGSLLLSFLRKNGKGQPERELLEPHEIPCPLPICIPLHRTAKMTADKVWIAERGASKGATIGAYKLFTLFV